MPSEIEAPPIEVADFFERLGFADESVLTEVIEQVLETSADRIAQMRSALSAGEASQLAFATHTLKGSAGFASAGRLRQLCETIESDVHLAGQRDLASHLQAIDLELGRIEHWLTVRVAGSSATEHV